MNTTLKYGLIGGGLLASLNTFYFFDLYQYQLFNKLWMVLKLLILVIVILLAIKERKSKQGNEINYRDAIMTGLTVNLLAALLFSFSLFLIFHFSASLLDSFKSNSLQMAEAYMKAKEYKAADIVKYMQTYSDAFTPFTIAKDNLMQTLLIGLILTLIIAFFQRNKVGNNAPSIQR